MMLTILTILLSAVATGNTESISEANSQWLRYNNGTAQWFTWVGAYRCVWFDVQDFVPGAGTGYVQETEFWFYHRAEFPWDTSGFYAEIWSGDLSGLVSRLDQSTGTGIHYAAMYVSYDPSISVDQTFWVVDNSEMSAGGWPSILADDQTGVGHSWESGASGWQEFTWGEYFVGVNWSNSSALSRTSWGKLKTVF